MPEPIDLRSDTVTQPSPAMRQAMASARVGDDVFEDDPTVVELEATAAELLGKEAGLFVASGTMGNLVSLIAHVPRGGEIIADARSHTVIDEQAGHAVIVGASIRQLRSGADGTLDPADVRRAFRVDDIHEPVTSLVIIENTHAHSMGQPLDAAYTARIAAIAHEHGVPLHIDGARLFNAAVALGIPARELVASADSVTFCLSKGLACPIGSLVVGSRGFIARARRARKLVGGGMRQVGVVAAAGLVALRPGPDGMIDRLAEDHDRARELAAGIASVPGISGLDPSRVRTDFVIFRVPDRTAFLDAIEREGVLMVPWGDHEVRAVTHYGIDGSDVARAVEAVARVMRDLVPVAMAS
jgi:threonine aldolase